MRVRMLSTHRHLPFLALLIALLVTATVGCQKGSQMTQTEKDAIQNAMSVYIQEKTASEGGIYLVEGTKMEFDYLHDGVETKQDTYISCADFKVGEDVYDLDYYVKYVDEKPTVMKEVLHKINGKEVNRTLWEKSP